MASRAPAHLAKPTAAWWRSVVAEYRLEDHHVRLLTLACEAWDRAQEARTTLEAEGSYFIDRFKQPKAHPAIAVERESRVSFARLLRELDLEGDPQPDIRPPRRR